MSDSEKLTGLIAAPLTGFNADGSVNLNVIPGYASLLHANGVTGAFVNGTTGEGLLLTMSERKALCERWAADAPEGFKVIVHITCASIEESKQLAAHAQQVGADAIGVMGPVFYKPANVEALVNFVGAIAAEAPELPCHYYHIPVLNGVAFPMIDFLKAAHGIIPNLAGIKYTDEDMMDADICRQFADGQYNILHGRDETLLSGLIMGATGGVGSTYNFMAPLYTHLIAAYNTGDIAKARMLQRKSADIIKCIARTGNYFSAAKAIMRWLGIDLNGIRSPLTEITSEAAKTMRQELTTLDFFEFCNHGEPELEKAKTP